MVADLALNPFVQAGGGGVVIICDRGVNLLIYPENSRFSYVLCWLSVFFSRSTYMKESYGEDWLQLC